jgi:pyruvate/2-oxoglutarate dehydrogenase complex dihydrolipoamide acyltransferase (E2) component
MDKIGKYTVRPFTKSRKNIVVVASEGHRKLKIDTLLELDVTVARRLMREARVQGRDVSLTGWLVKCLAQAASEHPELNSYRQGWNKLVVFEDVDVSITIEREVAGDMRPLVHLIRGAQVKSLAEITGEVRLCQREAAAVSDQQVLGMELTGFERFVLGAPMWVKRLLLGLFRRRGLLKKKYFGTMAVTAIGMKGRFPGWVIPLGGPVSAIAAVGGITAKPGVVDGVVVPREFLHLTLTVDHAVIDGGPLVRFVERFSSLVESAAFLG